MSAARRPRAIGTAAESAVVRVARLRGFPFADRIALHGSRDIGDVALCPGVVVEVKGGEQARDATDKLVERWLDQTDTERRNGGAAHAFLVVQRRHVGAPNADRWWAFWRLSWLESLTAGTDAAALAHPSMLAVVRVRLGPALDLLRVSGFGEPFQCSVCDVEPVLAGLRVCVGCHATIYAAGNPA